MVQVEWPGKKLGLSRILPSILSVRMKRQSIHAHTRAQQRHAVEKKSNPSTRSQMWQFILLFFCPLPSSLLIHHNWGASSSFHSCGDDGGGLDGRCRIGKAQRVGSGFERWQFVKVIVHALQINIFFFFFSGFIKFAFITLINYITCYIHNPAM